MALEEIPLKRIKTPVGDVAEYSSFRDGLNTVAQAVIDLRTALTRLDDKVHSDLNTLDAELTEVRAQVSEIRGELAETVKGLREGLDELAEKLLHSIEGKLANIEKAVEDKIVPFLESLKSQNAELSKLTRFLALRLEQMEVRLSSLEKTVHRFTLFSLRREAL